MIVKEMMTQKKRLVASLIPRSIYNLSRRWKSLCKNFFPSSELFGQPRPPGLLRVQNGGRRTPGQGCGNTPRIVEYFCHVTHEEMAFSEVVSSVWRPRLFSAILQFGQGFLRPPF